MKMIIPMTLCLWTPVKSNLMIIMMMSLITMIIAMNTNSHMILIAHLFYLDSLSTIMISLSILSTLLIFMSINYHKPKSLLMYIMLILILTFMSSKMLMFYILFELVLIPTLMLITKLGTQPERLKAGMYLIIYTVMASLPLLIGILMLNMNESFIHLETKCETIYIPLIFMTAFLAKMPMYSLHLWLPKAHVEAPLEGSMILAAVLLKLGGYGLIRFMPLMSLSLKNIPLWLISLSLMGAIFTSMNCIRQKDLKALIAYSSVAHMGLVLSSILTLNMMATNGAIIMMIAHGLTSAALFFLVNLIYIKYHSRNIMMFKGLLNSFPNLSFWWFLFTAANVSAPPSMNLISEIMMMMGVISWKMMTMITLSIISLSTTSFSILLYVMISHNKSPLNPSQDSKSKFYLSLFIHMILVLTLTIKLEFMMML